MKKFITILLLAVVTSASAQNGGQWAENSRGKIWFRSGINNTVDTIYFLNKQSCEAEERLNVNGSERTFSATPNVIVFFTYPKPITSAKVKPLTNCGGSGDMGWLELSVFPLPLKVLEFKIEEGLLKWNVTCDNEVYIQYSHDTRSWENIHCTFNHKSQITVRNEGYYRIMADNEFSKIIRYKEGNTSEVNDDSIYSIFGQKLEGYEFWVPLVIGGKKVIIVVN